MNAEQTVLMRSAGLGFNNFPDCQILYTNDFIPQFKLKTVIEKQLRDLEVSSVGEIGTAMLSAYDLAIDLGNGIKVEIGRFSQSALGRIMFAGGFPTEGPVLTIGTFCEFALECTILLGSNHANESLFNYAFGQTELFKGLLSKDDWLKCFEPPRQTVIGDCVLFSYRSTILSGASVGSGSIIGAGAIISGEHPPYGVLGGVPARRLKDRFDTSTQKLHASLGLPRVRAHDVPRLPGLLTRLLNTQLSIDDYLSEVSFLQHRPKIGLAAEINKVGRIQIKGIKQFWLSDRVVDDPNTVGQLTSYFSQAFTPNTKIRWSPDIFHYLGLD